MASTRNTKQKKIILSILENAERPLSAGEIHALALQSCPSMAVTTVYRNLEAMADRHEVVCHRLSDNQVSYELSRNAHSHYLVCLGCNRLIPLHQCPLHGLEQKVLEETGFQVSSHHVELFGYCAKCRAQKEKDHVVPHPAKKQD